MVFLVVDSIFTNNFIYLSLDWINSYSIFLLYVSILCLHIWILYCVCKWKEIAYQFYIMCFFLSNNSLILSSLKRVQIKNSIIRTMILSHDFHFTIRYKKKLCDKYFFALLFSFNFESYVAHNMYALHNIYVVWWRFNIIYLHIPPMK